MKMSLFHRINVWRIARRCPVCGAERGYSQANPGGLEFNCDDGEHCGFSEFVSTGIIHNRGNQIDDARYEVLDQDNKVRTGWKHELSDSELALLKTKCEKYIKERDKMDRWIARQIKKNKKLVES